MGGAAYDAPEHYAAITDGRRGDGSRHWCSLQCARIEWTEKDPEARQLQAANASQSQLDAAFKAFVGTTAQARLRKANAGESVKGLAWM